MITGNSSGFIGNRIKRTAVLTLALAMLIISNASATLITTGIYSFTPDPADLYDLEHSKYYIWKIDDFPAEQAGNIVSANLTIEDINNWADNDNILYIHLLSGDDFETGNANVPAPFPPGSTNSIYIGSDSQGQGDNLDNYDGVKLDEYVDASGGSSGDVVTYSYDFDPDEISYLKTCFSDASCGLGFDPDCHFWNDGVILSINTLPVPATMVLLALGGVLFGRRRG